MHGLRFYTRIWWSVFEADPEEQSSWTRLLKKISQILDNPFIGDPKRHELLHARGSHVDPYVIVYVVKGNIITFLCVGHHDFVYGKAAEIMKKWEDEI